MEIVTEVTYGHTIKSGIQLIPNHLVVFAHLGDKEAIEEIRKIEERNRAYKNNQ